LVREIGLDASAYGTHTLKRMICRRAKNLSCRSSFDRLVDDRAIQIADHTGGMNLGGEGA